MPTISENRRESDSGTGPALERGVEGVTSAKYLASEKLMEKKKQKPKSVRTSRDKEPKGKNGKSKSSRKRK